MSILSSASSLVTGVNKAMLILTGDVEKELSSKALEWSESITSSVLDQSAITAQSVNTLFSDKNADAGNYKILEVQYNPSSISIQGAVAGAMVSTLQRKADFDEKKRINAVPSVVLAVELTFDDMKLYECFVTETLTSGVSTQTGLNAVGGLVDYAKGSSAPKHSVLDMTNGLAYACINDKTRNVIFKWADMTFKGELTQVDAKYTMFSTSGAPVRSVVQIQITQGLTSRDDHDIWSGQVKELFSQTKPTPMNHTSWGNLLNWE